MPDTKSTCECDMTEFFPKENLPTTSVGTTIAASLDTIKANLQDPFPQHSILHFDDDDVQSVVNKLKKMYGS